MRSALSLPYGLRWRPDISGLLFCPSVRKSAMRRIATLAGTAGLLAAPVPAFAYSCALSPAKDAVIVKTDNASDRALSCKVDCQFTSPQGPVTISCTQSIPANSKAWYVCLRSTGGKALEFTGGSESCK